jgi:hypothetical protein
VTFVETPTERLSWINQPLVLHELIPCASA